MATITDAEVSQAIRWLERMGRAAKMKKQAENMKEAENARRVIRVLSGR